MSIRQIAKYCGLSYSGVNYYFDKYQIPKRTRGKAQLGKKNSMFGKTGIKHPRYGTKHTEKSISLMKKKRAGKNNPMYGQKRVDLQKKFSGAGNPFFGKTHTKQTREKLSGENHYNWKGGVTELANKIRQLPEYKKWRLACFERDDYKCKTCGNQGGLLQVDHIKQFALIIKENNISNTDEAKQCQELWLTKNGRTMCVGCHKQTETFGKKLSI